VFWTADLLSRGHRIVQVSTDATIANINADVYPLSSPYNCQQLKESEFSLRTFHRQSCLFQGILSFVDFTHVWKERWQHRINKLYSTRMNWLFVLRMKCKNYLNGILQSNTFAYWRLAGFLTRSSYIIWEAR
jgi:hypothetical protein